MAEYSIEQIAEFWTSQALSNGLSPSASWSDIPMINMEIREIIKWLSDGDKVLDVGCANGYSTVQFASQKAVSIRGVDYIPEMVNQARTRLAMLSDKLAGRVEFDTGNAMELRNEPDNAYDAVICVRVIINLMNWEHQLKGLRACARVLKPGGLFLLSEATVQGWNKLNAFRREWGLTDIPMPKFNEYLDQDKVVDELSDELECLEISDFASTYYVGTRVFKPLLARAAGDVVNIANPDMEFNRFMAALPAGGDYGTQKLFVFRKMRQKC